MHNLESQTFSRNSAHSCFRRSSCWNTMALFLKMSATATASLSPNSFPVLLTILENCWRSWNVTGCMYCWMSLQGGDGQSKNSRIWSKVASFGSEAVIQCGLLSLCMASQASVKVSYFIRTNNAPNVRRPITRCMKGTYLVIHPLNSKLVCLQGGKTEVPQRRQTVWGQFHVFKLTPSPHHPPTQGRSPTNR